MKLITTILTTLFSQPLFAIENLSQVDYIGTWTSEWAVVDGESQTLTVSEDKSSVFERNFDTGQKLIFKSNNIEYIDDLLIIKYNNDKGELIVKLVMSGWYAYGRYTLYGSMHMYKEGTQYNALTVSLKRDKKGKQ